MSGVLINIIILPGISLGNSSIMPINVLINDIVFPPVELIANCLPAIS